MRHRTIKRRLRGVSLMEMLVVCVIAGGALAAILGIFGMALRRWNVEASRNLAMQQANVAMSRMRKEISGAVSFTAISAGGLNYYVFTLPNATDSSGNYIPQRSGATLSYGSGAKVYFYLSDATGSILVLNGKILWRAYVPAGQVVPQPDTEWSLRATGKGRCENVQSLTVTTVSANVVQITLTVAATEGKETRTHTVTRQVYMANHN